MVRVTVGNLVNNQTGSSPDGQAWEAFATVTINGASNVTIVDSGYTLGDIVLFGLLTVGGTVGNTPKVTTGTTGTGFTVAGTASDTSVYSWVRFTPAAQQNT